MDRFTFVPDHPATLAPFGILCCLALTSCGGSDAPAQASAGSAAFPEQAALTATGDAHTLQMEVRSAPSQPPTRGTSSIELRLFSADTGLPVDGLAVSVVPFMPAMGHGSPTTPSVSAAGDGRYVLSDVSLTMPGVWELRTTISGAVSDYVAPSFDVQ